MDDLPLAWARDLLNFSLRATASTTSPSAPKSPGLGDPTDPGKDPRFRKLVGAVLFSRRFLLTYNVVLLAILLIFTLWHWGEKYVLKQERRRVALEALTVNDANTFDDGCSSSGSTLAYIKTSPDEDKRREASESSPLLRSSASKTKRVRSRKILNLLKSWMQYQPAPIPVFNKSLPPNSVSLFVLAFLGLNIFYNIYHIPYEAQYIFVFADRCGGLFVANLPLLYLLSAKNQPIKFMTGHSYEALNIFHRRVGELLCFEALLHFLGMDLVWYGLLRRLGLSLSDFLLNRVILLGLGAFVAYEVLYLTSLGSFRQRFYEIFLATHIFLQIAGLALLYFHHRISRPYVLISLAIFLFDRLIFRLWLKSSSHTATLTVLDSDTLLLSANWDTHHPATLLKPTSMAHGWQPNNHIFLTVPSLSHKHALQAHPFTVFSAAPSPGHHAWFSLLIRIQRNNGFTRALFNHVSNNPTTLARIRLDGPYGSSHALDVLSASDNAVVVAGGSGIAVAYPLLFALLQPHRTYHLEGEDTTARLRRRKVKLLWITHSPCHKGWVPEDKMQELIDWGLQVLIPRATSEAGRPDVGKIVRGWVEGESERTGVEVSGPDGLVRDVRNTCAGLVGEGYDVKMQVEKFGW
ncbi:ferric reductase transmembrane component [Sporormia fimetaria CBS 119925]|uniref:ferric-chelate reductase (NADPH) n=1 Tax=Sporormia fimetaria CBS 119925 TaxID=1340428 RepID=A0A6A6VF82_9PLEO|nr:ferric reductase transmembrane component [Sporormia fimetaria CBS 119925]